MVLASLFLMRAAHLNSAPFLWVYVGYDELYRVVYKSVSQ